MPNDVTVSLPPNIARDLLRWIKVAEQEPDWDQIEAAVRDGLDEYDGPDDSDGRCFTPPYEP